MLGDFEMMVMWLSINDLRSSHQFTRPIRTGVPLARKPAPEKLKAAPPSRARGPAPGGVQTPLRARMQGT